jgi:hypothetical protein
VNSSCEHRLARPLIIWPRSGRGSFSLTTPYKQLTVRMKSSEIQIQPFTACLPTAKSGTIAERNRFISAVVIVRHVGANADTKVSPN